MVLPNTYCRRKLDTTAPPISFRWLWHATSLTAPCLLCALALSVTCLSAPTYAQENDFDFVDALAPVDASASAFHNEKFSEAERALTQGLSRKAADGAPSMQQPKMRQVSANQQQTVSQQLPKLVESPQRADAAFENDGRDNRSVLNPANRSADTDNTQLLRAINDQTEQQVQGPKTPRGKPAGSKAVAKSAASNKPATTSKAITVANQVPEQPKQSLKIQEQKISEDTIQLRRELADTKSQLAAAELEIARLSAIIQDASRARLSLPPTGTKLLKAVSKEEVPTPAAVEPKPQAQMTQREPVTAPNPNHDLQVATISVDKADLRLGPGRNHSALMSLRRGSRLAVEARQGEWYRVFAPNGQRAWIHAGLVRFGDGASSLNDGSSVTVRGYDSKLQ